MKLSVNTWYSGSSSLEEEVAKSSKFEFDGCEVAGFPSRFTPKRRTSIRKLVSDLHLQITSVSVGIPFVRNPDRLNLHSTSTRVRRRSIDYVHRCIDLASDIGSKFVYVCSAKKDGCELGLLRESLIACAEYADAVGLRIGLEHFPAGIVPKFDCALRLVSELRMRNLGVLLDTGHVALENESVAECVSKSKGALMLVHVNNNDGAADVHLPPQTGKLSKNDFKNMMQSLAAIHYEGYLSLELAHSDKDLFDFTAKSFS